MRGPFTTQLDHLHATWRVQLACVGLATLLHAGAMALAGTGFLVLSTVLAVLATIALLGASAGSDDLRTALAPELVARRTARALGCLAPLAAVLVFASALGFVHPALGLACTPLALVLAAACGSALVAVTCAPTTPGVELAWFPADELRRVAAARWRWLGGSLVAVVAVPFALVPTTLTGVLLATAGSFGAVGFGLASAVSIPFVACTGRWAACAVGMARAEPRGTVADAAAVHTAADEGWHRIYAWRGVVDVAAPDGGEWLDLAVAARLGLRVSADVPTMFEVLVCGPDGAWIRAGVVSSAGAPLLVDFQPGRSLVRVRHLQGVAAAAVAVYVELLVPAAGATATTAA